MTIGGGLFQVGLKDAAKLRARTRKPKPPKGAKSEHSLHWHVNGLLEKHLALPAWHTTFPAGGGGEMRGRILKSLGLKSGVPDILIVNPVPLRIIRPPIYIEGNAIEVAGPEGMVIDTVTVPFLYWIELKKLNKGIPSDDQIKTQQRLVEMGCRVANCDNFEHVKAVLAEWQLPYQAMTPTETNMQTAMRNSFANV